MAGDVTAWLLAWRSGDRTAVERLVPVLYAELRAVAKRQLAQEARDHTLSPTALVHEAYVRLVQQRQLAASDRGHFLALAGLTMRRILVDHARARGRLKRGGAVRADNADDVDLLDPRALEEILAVDLALERLARDSERAARVVECRIFAGLTLEETAQVLELSTKSVQRTWATALAWLRKEVGFDPSSS